MIKVGCLDFFDFQNERNNDIIYGGYEQNGSQYYEILIKPLLEKGIEIEPCNCLKEECDIVFISCYPRHLSQNILGNPIIIFWTYESMYKFNIETDYNYSISFWTDSDNNLHYPWWQHEYWRFKETYNPNKANIVKDKFCAFVASNTNFIKPNFDDGVYLREYIAQEVSKTYKKIDCYGYTKINNMDGALISWELDEANELLSKYKFYFCFENSLSINNEYYTTEKLINGFAYNCVPIYWGNHSEYLNKYFNPKSYINCTGMTPNEIIETIKYYDTHDDEYYAMLKENPFNDMSINWREYGENRYIDFMIKIFTDNNLNYSLTEDDTNIFNYFNLLKSKPTNIVKNDKINDISASQNYMVYIINNKNKLSSEKINDISLYLQHNKLLSYPQVNIPEINNIKYSLSECDNIFQYHHCLNEFCYLYYIYKNENYKKYDYIALTNFNQIWEYKTLNLLNQIFNNYDIICPSITKTPEDTYTRIKYVSTEIDEFISICKEKFPEYINTIDVELPKHSHYCYNMFIMKSDELENYYNFVSTIIFEYLTRHNLNNDNDIYNYIVKNPDICYCNNDNIYDNLDEVSKYISNIEELFTHIYIIHNYKKIFNSIFIEYTETIEENNDFKFYICNHLDEDTYNSIPNEVDYINNYQEYFSFVNYPIRPNIPGFDNIDIDLDKDNLFELDMLYSEYAKMYYIWKNENLDNIKYIGNFHYRRFFSEDIYDNINKYLSNYDCILTENTNLEDWIDLCINKIGREKLGLNFDNLDLDILFDKDFYSCNMYIMKKEDFTKYMEWSSKILLDIQHQMHIYTKYDYYNYIENTAKNILSESIDTNGIDIELSQVLYRYIAYISEFIFSYWIKKNINRDKIYVSEIVFGNTFKDLTEKEEIKIYIFNHLPKLPEEIVDEYKKNDIYSNKYSFLSYPQTMIPNVDNISYDLSTCKNIFEFDHSVGEISKMYFIYKNLNYKHYNYIGFGHYRRFFQKSTVDIVSDIFNNYDVILPKITENPDNVNNYTKIKWGCLVFDDFIKIVEELFPEYHNTLIQELNSTTMYCNHLFIMKSDDFSKYINFMYKIVMTYIAQNNLIDDNDILNQIRENDMKYCWWDKDNNNEETLYQATRFIATAMEFFSHLFFIHNYNHIYEAGNTYLIDII